MKIRKVKVEFGEEGTGYGPLWFDITASEESDIARAVETEHGCDIETDTSCDIGRALEEGYPYVAADSLSSATETPLLGKVFWAHTVNGTAQQAQGDGRPLGWNKWLEYFKENALECGSCGAFSFETETCGNCLHALYLECKPCEGDGDLWKEDKYIGDCPVCEGEGKLLEVRAVQLAKKEELRKRDCWPRHRECAHREYIGRHCTLAGKRARVVCDTEGRAHIAPLDTSRGAVPYSWIAVFNVCENRHGAFE